MNKFEKYCWNNFLKDSFFGKKYFLIESLILLKISFMKSFGFKNYKHTKKEYRIIDFMGIR